MKRLATFSSVTTTSIAGAVFGLAMTGFAATAGAETRIETVLGTVTKSDPLTTSYIRKTPTDQRTCRVEEVPVYGESSGGSSDLGAMIVGGLLGSAIGNKASDNDGAGAAGAVAGALLGREHAKKNKQQGEIVGYRQQEICETRTVIVEENIEKVTGYRNRIEVDNKIITLETARPLALNERVEIERQVTYTIR